MPPLVPLGDSEAHFGAALRKARYQITIYLCHNQRGRWASLRLDEDAARAVSSASSRAMETFAAVAPAFEGVAAFIGLDWFDNPPDLIQFVAGAGATEESLPFAVAVPSRLGQHDDQPRGHMLRGSALQQEEAVRRLSTMPSPSKVCWGGRRPTIRAGGRSPQALKPRKSSRPAAGSDCAARSTRTHEGSSSCSYEKALGEKPRGSLCVGVLCT